MNISYEKLIEDSKKLGQQIKGTEYKYKYDSVYGIPSGGVLPAYIIAEILELPLVKVPGKMTLIVDDILDSGKTLSKWEGYNTAVIYNKELANVPVDYVLERVPNEWILLPHEKEETGIEDHITRIFEYIGENPNREGLKGTPERIIRMWKEIFRGYDELQKPKITVFDNGKDGIFYDQMICDSGKYYSQCEHHGVPFFGDYYFAYIPNEKILGLSKIARIVGYYSAKLQIQERLVKEIVDEIEKAIKPQGIALIMKGRHLCKEMRGARNQGEMITSEMRGIFREDAKVRQEFLQIIR